MMQFSINWNFLSTPKKKERERRTEGLQKKDEMFFAIENTSQHQKIYDIPKILCVEEEEKNHSTGGIRHLNIIETNPRN